MKILDRRTALLQELTTTVGSMMWQGERQSMVAAEHVGLTLPQQTVLLAIDAQGGQMIMSELGRLTHQSPATLTGIVDRLVGAGLVERTRDTVDRRVVHVGLTPAGHARLARANEARLTDVARITAAFSADELALFDRLLQKFVAGLAAMVDAGGAATE
ncbi:MAG TPA: MarR family transcriptional regulator [Chloroflexia bacterium]|nr:MarR family transcriptional regulator [Chloroflexia bacterium]